MVTTVQSTISDLSAANEELGVDLESFDRLSGKPNVNTRLGYRYCDVNNYKQFEEVVFAGEITADQLQAIIDHRDEDGGFIPGQVGLPDLQPRFVGGHDEDMDHPFHDFNDLALVEDPANNMPIAEFAALFEQVSWDHAHTPC